MARGDLVVALRKGRAAFEDWCHAYGRKQLDLTNADLFGVDLSGMDLSGANLTTANLSNTTCKETDFSRTTFRRVKATSAKMHRAIFRQADCAFADFTDADMSEVNITSANFSQAILHRCNLSKCVCDADEKKPRASFRETNMVGAAVTDATLWLVDFDLTDLTGADLSRTTFYKCAFNNDVKLIGAKLNDARFSGGIFGGDLQNASLRKTDLSGVILINCRFIGADLHGANFYESEFRGGDFSGAVNVFRAKALETTHSGSSWPRYFEHCLLRWQEKRCSWDMLRTFGQLPLFGLSYSTLILVPLYCYIIAWYNAQVDRLQGGPVGEFTFIANLTHLPLPKLSLLLLLSTLALAVASTLYALFCPSRVKEFTQAIWCDQLGKPLLHYSPFAWKYPTLRVVCGSCYLAGGVGVLIVLAQKIVAAGTYIVAHAAL